MTNQEIVDQTSLVLRENKNQWEDVYAKHIQIIKDNAKSEDLYLSKYCQINSPLTLYSSISKAKSESVIYDLRFAGKSSGDDWWNNFKDKGKNKDQQTVPSELHIDAISLMPEGNSEEGDLETVLEVKGLGKKIYIHPYSLYFEKDNKGNPTRFFGTLINEINK